MDDQAPAPSVDAGASAVAPDLTDLFAAEESPMVGRVVVRVALVGAVVLAVVWLVRRRRA